MIEELLRPINAEQPAGIDCEEGQHYELLDEMMAQYGSLHQEKIQWDDVERIASLVLTQECKHFKVLLFYITARMVREPLLGIGESLPLLAGFWTQYQEEGFPNGSKRNAQRRRMMLDQMLARIDRFVQKDLVLPEEGQAPIKLQSLEVIEQGFAELKVVLEEGEIDNPLNSIPSKLAELRRFTAPAEGVGQQRPSNVQAPKAKASTTRDDKNLKAQLQELADQSSRQQADSPLGYLLRRHAKWQGIASVPPGKKSQPEITEMAPPNADIVSEYRDQIQAQNYSLELLQRIEKTAMNTPFWLTGSAYAAQVAYGLGYVLVAKSIVQASEQFLARIPALSDSQFNDGTPFIDKELWQAVQALLSAADNAAGAVATSATQNEWSDIQQEIEHRLTTQGVLETLDFINQCKRRAQSQRQAYYLQLFACETLHQSGLSVLAGDMLDAALEKSKTFYVSDWEPDYLQRIQALLDATEHRTNER